MKKTSAIEIMNTKISMGVFPIPFSLLKVN
jgi:hypothetical protein